jgi:hypothetical protein
MALSKFSAMDQSTDFVYLSRVVHNINRSNGRSIVSVYGTAHLMACLFLRIYDIEV